MYSNKNNHWRTDESKKPNDFDFFGIHLPSGRDGFTYMDIDGMVRWHGPKFKTDDEGYYIFQERKTFEPWKNKTLKDIPWHEYKKYRLLDSDLKCSERYKGIYLIWSNNSGFELSNEFQINGIDITKNELIDFYWSRLFDRFPAYDF